MRITVIVFIGWNLYAMSYSVTFPAAENPIFKAIVGTTGRKMASIGAT